MEISDLYQIYFSSKNYTKKVLVFGDLILDKYISCDGKKISPENTSLVLQYKNTFYRLGGAANVALNLKMLGIKVHLLGLIGNDDNSKIIFNLLKKFKIQSTLLKCDNKITTKIRIHSENQTILRIDDDMTSVIKEKDYKNLERIFHKLTNNIEYLVFPDYGKGALKYIASYLKFAKKKKIKTFVDPIGSDLSIYKNTYLLKPNSNEFKKLIGEYRTIEELVYKSRIYLKNYAIESILVTLGKDGLCFINTKEYITFNSGKKEIYDLTGAGDTVLSSFILSNIAGISLSKTTFFIDLCAKCVIAKYGTSFVNYKDIFKNMRMNNQIFLENKIDISDFINFLKSMDLKIVFTNGCYDIIHPGHIHNLRESKLSGDILIVGLNSDKSVKKLKGNGRPINSIISRFKNLSDNKNVDFIISFSEMTPLNLIKKIKPDIITKGSDYKQKQVVGYDYVKKYGGQVKIIPLLKGLSTSKILSRIK